MEAEGSSKMLVPIYQTTWLHIQQHCNGFDSALVKLLPCFQLANTVLLKTSGPSVAI
jgi:hypothetical protein